MLGGTDAKDVHRPSYVTVCAARTSILAFRWSQSRLLTDDDDDDCDAGVIVETLLSKITKTLILNNRKRYVQIHIDNHVLMHHAYAYLSTHNTNMYKCTQDEKEQTHAFPFVSLQSLVVIIIDKSC